jgi:2-dehydropantoate 2-reductase
LQQPETKEMLVNALTEAVQVARASGMLSINEEYIKNLMAMFEKNASLEPGITTSMTRDFIEERPSEFFDLTGCLLEHAKSVNVNVPTHKLIYTALLALEKKARKDIEFPPMY